MGSLSKLFSCSVYTLQFFSIVICYLTNCEFEYACESVLQVRSSYKGLGVVVLRCLTTAVSSVLACACELPIILVVVVS